MSSNKIKIKDKNLRLNLKILNNLSKNDLVELYLSTLQPNLYKFSYQIILKKYSNVTNINNNSSASIFDSVSKKLFEINTTKTNSEQKLKNQMKIKSSIFTKKHRTPDQLTFQIKIRAIKLIKILSKNEFSNLVRLYQLYPEYLCFICEENYVGQTKNNKNKVENSQKIGDLDKFYKYLALHRVKRPSYELCGSDRQKIMNLSNFADDVSQFLVVDELEKIGIRGLG